MYKQSNGMDLNFRICCRRRFLVSTFNACVEHRLPVLTVHAVWEGIYRSLGAAGSSLEGPASESKAEEAERGHERREEHFSSGELLRRQGTSDPCEDLTEQECALLCEQCGCCSAEYMYLRTVM